MSLTREASHKKVGKKDLLFKQIINKPIQNHVHSTHTFIFAFELGWSTPNSRLQTPN